ncbi:hypothetical protein FHG87_022385 [Trinorchestia longiramus]|nr:hypothetical protein FHG87_022385 [Trinorchestia longiramus]
MSDVMRRCYWSSALGLVSLPWAPVTIGCVSLPPPLLPHATAVTLPITAVQPCTTNHVLVYSSVSQSGPYSPPGGAEEMQGAVGGYALNGGRILLYNIQ